MLVLSTIPLCGHHWICAAACPLLCRLMRLTAQASCRLLLYIGEKGGAAGSLQHGEHNDEVAIAQGSINARWQMQCYAIQCQKAMTCGRQSAAGMCTDQRKQDAAYLHLLAGLQQPELREPLLHCANARVLEQNSNDGFNSICSHFTR